MSAMTWTGHPPRPHKVTCLACIATQTPNHHAICDTCKTDPRWAQRATCERCAPEPGARTNILRQLAPLALVAGVVIGVAVPWDAVLPWSHNPQPATTLDVNR